MSPGALRGTVAEACPAGSAGSAAHPDTSAARTRLLSDLQGWTARYPAFDPRRFPALALTTTAFLPAARDEDRELAALVSLWIIAFDALVDERNAGPAALSALAARYDVLVAPGSELRGHGGPPPGDMAEQLAAALHEIGARLAAYDPPAALWAWWATSCRATIAAIVRQRKLGRAGGMALGYDLALPLLLESIGVRPYLAAGAIVGREPDLAARLATVAGLASECALAVRLANDLRTWEKDEREGGFNTLVALGGELARADPGLSVAVAHEHALGILEDRLGASRARLAASGGAGEIEAGVARLVEVVVGIYATDDFHTFQNVAGAFAPAPL